MARRQSVGELRIVAVPTIADISAPTVAEVTAGVDLTPYLTRDGLTTPDSGRTVDASDMANLQDKTQRGSRGGDSLTITAHRNSESADDEAWATLTTDYDGYIVIRRFGGSAVAVAAADVVEVWPVSVISREMAGVSGDQTQRFTATCAVTDTVEYEGAVAA